MLFKITTMNNKKILKPQEGFQQKFLESKADIVIGGGAAGCMISDTLVNTSEGYKEIIDVKVGDYVLSLNVDTKELEYKEVINTFRYGGPEDTKEMCDIKINNQTIQLTTNHEFYIESNWIATELIAKRVLERNTKNKQKVLCFNSRENSNNELEKYRSSKRISRDKNTKGVHASYFNDRRQEENISSAQTCSNGFSTEPREQTSSKPYRQSKTQQLLNKLRVVYTSRELRPLKRLYEVATSSRLFERNVKRFSNWYSTINGTRSKGNQTEIYTESLQQRDTSERVQRNSIVYKGYSNSQELEACELNIDNIESVNIYQTNEYVYDLCVADNHNYVITTDNIIVHNSGKALSLDTNIIDGVGNTINMMDLGVGMEVMGDDGKPTTITAIHDHSDLIFYEVEFTDTTKIKACEDHLWRVRESGEDWEVLSTKDMLGTRNQYEVPLVKPLQLKEIDNLPIDPYLMGVFLGDGHFMKGGSVSVAVGFEELAGFASILPTPHKLYDGGSCYKLIYNQYKKEIKQLGLNGMVRDDKFIPGIYLKGSIEQRLALLQGLMDTDGTVSTRLSGSTAVSFCNQNKNLIDGVVELVRSLGGVTSLYHYKTDTRDEYYVNIRMAYYNPFKLDRKANVFIPKYNIKKKIKSITCIENQPGRCITVDNRNKCYITEDYTVTHNSYALLLELGRLINVENATGVVFRRTSPELRAGGGLWDTASQIYGSIADINNTKLELSFDSNAKIKFSHLQKEGDVHSHQGSQYAFVGFDEVQHFTWKQFNYMLSRNRTMTNINPYIRCTCNPEAGVWLRDFIDWWIGGDGYPVNERDGKLRYMYSKGDKVTDIIWGDTKQEVIDKLDGLLEETAERFGVKAEDLIKSVTFIAGSLDDNQKLLENNPQYIGNLLALGDVEKAKLLYGNWNEYNDDTTRLFNNIDGIFMDTGTTDPNGLYSISVDPARSGKDLAVIIAWKGFEAIAMQIFTKCSTEDIYNAVETFREIYNIPRQRVIVDSDGVGGGVVDRGRYLGINNGGRPINSVNETTNFDHLKSQLYYLGARVINNHAVTGFRINTNQIYVDGKKTTKVNGELVMDIIQRELEAYTRDFTLGKKRINNKKEIKSKIGHSPDFSDCVMYSFYNVLNRRIYGLNQPIKVN